MADELAPRPPGGQFLIYSDGGRNLQVRLDGQTVWLSQLAMAELFQSTKQNISLHLQNIFEEGELEPSATVKKYLTVQTEGSRQVRRAIDHYNLDAILAVGYRVRSHVGTAFRQWATARLSELLVKGFTMDDERIKAGRTLGDDYFEELLARIRDIRSSERLFYQKITDIYGTSVDYDKGSPLGPIPKGWRVGTVGENFRLTMGQSPPGSTYNESGDGTPFYQGRTDFGFRFPTRRVYRSAPTRIAEEGDTLVSVRAPVGNVNIAIETCAVGRGVAAVRHLSGSRSLTYHAMHNLGSHFNTFEAEGTVFGSINKSDFTKLPFLESSKQLLDAFDRLIAPLDSKLETSERDNVALAALRDAFLPKLISGELRVPDAERIVGRISL